MAAPSMVGEPARAEQTGAQTLPILRDLWFEVKKLGIHCLRAGIRGHPVLLLHGGGLDAAGLSFRKTIPVLAQQHRVFAPDWPGFGLSDAMPITWRVEECVDFVGAILDALGLQRASLVGISMGGAFVLGFALRAPERIGRLVLVDSAGLGDEIPGGLLSYFTMRLPLLDELRWALLVGNRTLARKMLCAPLANRKHVLTEEILDEIIALARRAGSGAAFRQLQRSEYQWRGLRTNYLHRLSEIKVPTLLVHGAEDRVVPVSWAERAHSLIKNSKIEIIRRCGHLPPVEQPEQFNRIIRGFLLGQCASPDSRARFSWPSLGPGVHQVFQQCSQLAVNPGNPRKLDLHSGSVSGSASGRAGKISKATP
ncbi:MAG: alpha/beta fold hydrolase [Verrucomicrobia bacterium]|nr:alpha/beta fold hydrolase [Verrucomicrobiota bacterium]